MWDTVRQLPLGLGAPTMIKEAPCSVILTGITNNKSDVGCVLEPPMRTKPWGKWPLAWTMRFNKSRTKTNKDIGFVNP